jgi:RNA polymerase sigma-70 factor (ECF subfamily)
VLSPVDPFEQQLVAAMPFLRRFAMSVCRDATRADDLVQETLLKAMTHRASFQPGTNLGAWLTVILRNHFRSDIRRRWREVEDADGVHSLRVALDDSPLRKLEAIEILKLVGKMPEQFRKTLQLIADGATYEEVATEMHEHVGTIKSRAHRGREMLKAGA